ncbi:hypothetical protein [Ekhidna sp.]
MDLKWKSLVKTSDALVNDEVLNQIFYSDQCNWVSTDSLYSALALHTLYENSSANMEDHIELLTKASKVEFDRGNYREESIYFKELFNFYERELKRQNSLNSSQEYDANVLKTVILNFLVHLRLSDAFSELNININSFTKLKPSSSIEASIEEIAADCNVIVDSTGKAVGDYWSPYKAVDIIQKQLVSTRILPDISSLHLAEIVELKSMLSYHFDPLRAELLTMTESLRSMLNDNISEENINREATNLIITRVEPVLRNYATLVDSELKNKYRKYLKKGARMLGFAGLGLFFPQAFAWAMKDSIDLVSDSLSESMDIKPATETARFAIKMDSYFDK